MKDIGEPSDTQQLRAFGNTTLQTLQLWPSLDPTEMAQHEVDSLAAGRSLYAKTQFPNSPGIDVDIDEIKLPQNVEKLTAAVRKKLREPKRLTRRNSRPGKE